MGKVTWRTEVVKKARAVLAHVKRGLGENGVLWMHPGTTWDEYWGEDAQWYRDVATYNPTFAAMEWYDRQPGSDTDEGGVWDLLRWASRGSYACRTKEGAAKVKQAARLLRGV